MSVSVNYVYIFKHFIFLSMFNWNQFFVRITKTYTSFLVFIIFESVIELPYRNKRLFIIFIFFFIIASWRNFTKNHNIDTPIVILKTFLRNGMTFSCVYPITSTGSLSAFISQMYPAFTVQKWSFQWKFCDAKNMAQS